MLHLLALGVVLAAASLGPAHAVPESSRHATHRRSAERISVFQEGTQGWRILPSLPSSQVSSNDRLVQQPSACLDCMGRIDLSRRRDAGVLLLLMVSPGAWCVQEQGGLVCERRQLTLVFSGAECARDSSQAGCSPNSCS